MFPRGGWWIWVVLGKSESRHLQEKTRKKALENWNQCIKACQGAINILVKHLYISPHGYTVDRTLHNVAKRWAAFKNNPSSPLSHIQTFTLALDFSSLAPSFFQFSLHLLLLVSLLLNFWPLIKNAQEGFSQQTGSKKLFLCDVIAWISQAGSGIILNL